jgi:hypothetical protein
VVDAFFYGYYRGRVMLPFTFSMYNQSFEEIVLIRIVSDRKPK